MSAFVFRARSILQLTIIGFLAVVVLLIAALVVIARQLDSLSEQSQLTVNQSVAAMRASRVLIEQTTAMARNARQYMVLGDAELLEVYVDRRVEFIDAARTLRNLPLNSEADYAVASLVEFETVAFENLNYALSDVGAGIDYPALQTMADQISYDVDEWIDSQLLSLGNQTADTQRLMTFQALLLTGAAVAMAGFFTALITRPLKQIGRAINELGSGAYQDSIDIHGPRDLQALGQRLEWLRGRLDELEQERSSFFRHVSHELKTPLASMQEGAALLKEGVVGPLTSEQGEIISILSNSCQRLQGLIEDLLRFNTASFSVLHAMPQPVRLDKIVERVIAAHQLAIKSGRHQIKRRLEKMTVSGDPERLRVIIDNLFANAIKYSPEEGAIELSLGVRESIGESAGERVGEEAVFEIRDRGPGIPPAEVASIFQPFYQGSTPDRKYFKGTGLGLAIAKEYALSNNGTIELVDVQVGACFRATFPLAHSPVSKKAVAENQLQTDF